MTNAEVIAFLATIRPIFVAGVDYLDDDAGEALLTGLVTVQQQLEAEARPLPFGAFAALVRQLRYAVEVVEGCRASARRAADLRRVEDTLVQLRDADVHSRTRGR